MFPLVGTRDAALRRATVPDARQLMCALSSSHHCSKEGTWWFRKDKLLCCHKLRFFCHLLAEVFNS